MLKEELLAEYGLSQNQLAKAVGISPNRIAEIVNNRGASPCLRPCLDLGVKPDRRQNTDRDEDREHG